MEKHLPLSAEELHKILFRAHRIGNAARRKFIAGLLAMASSRLYLKLGFSSIEQYVESSFGYKRSQTYEFLSVAKALEEMRELDDAFRKGLISWTVLRHIVKVATPESQGKWLEFARKNSVQRTITEAKSAKEKGRTEPRADGSSMPNLKVKVSFELTPHEHEILSKALGKLREEMGRSLGEEVDPSKVLVYGMLELLRTDPEGGARRKERSEPFCTILYHLCPKCRKASLPTPEGPIEVPQENIQAIEGEAKKVVLKPEEELGGEAPQEKSKRVPKERRDRPNSSYIVKKVLLRDGAFCANPLCRRKLRLHAHHIRFRAFGGKTAPWNEITVCNVCHALLHLGFLKINGDPLTGVRFIPALAEKALDLEQEATELAKVPEVKAAESAIADFGGPGPDPLRELEKLTEKALRGLGCKKSEAKERARKAVMQARHGKIPKKEEDVIKAALVLSYSE